jgi:type II secretory pathway pseudopilin PulG
MTYHVAKNGEKSGPLEKNEVYRRLVSGELSGTDLGWHEGLAEWQPLSKLIPPPVAGSSSVFVSGTTFSIGSAQAVQTSSMAIASMICGILGLLFWLPCIPAIILGHMGLSAIKKSAGALNGKGMAITGLVTGYLVIALIPLIAILAAMAIPAFNKVQQQGNQMKVVSNARQLVLGMKQYAADHDGKYPPTLETLFEEHILTDRRLLQFPKSMDVPGQGWDYRGAEFSHSDAGNIIVLITKEEDQTQKKVVARNDGAVMVERVNDIH